MIGLLNPAPEFKLHQVVQCVSRLFFFCFLNRVNHVGVAAGSSSSFPELESDVTAAKSLELHPFEMSALKLKISVLALRFGS